MREALGCPPVPIYREPVQSPDGDLKREYPLVLITGSRFVPITTPSSGRASRGLLLAAWRAPGCGVAAASIGTVRVRP